MSNLIKKLWQKLGAILLHENWMIGVVDQPITNVISWTVCPPVQWLSVRSAKRYLADPFPWPERSDVILCEHYDFATQLGSIRKFHVEGSTLTRETDVDFSLPGHLSYPYLFRHEGFVYSIPESSAARELSIFCWQEQDRLWEKLHSPLLDVAAADSTLFREGEYFWIAYTNVDIGAMDNLNLIYAKSLTGPWQQHIQNPVVTGLRHSRCGGTPFRVNNKLYRPSQDCSKRYGGALYIMHVKECSPTLYEEVVVTHIQPESGQNPHGFHHIAAWGNKCLVDGKRMMFSPLQVLNKIKRRLLRSVKSIAEPITPKKLNKRKSIVFYMPNLTGGGAEKLNLLLASGILQAGYDATLLLHTAEGELADSIPAGVRVVSLNTPRTITAIVPLIRFLRHERPDILCSSLGHNNIIAVWAVALSRTKTPLVVIQHNALSSEVARGHEMKLSVLPLLYRIFLRYTQGIVAVSKGVADDMAMTTHIPRNWIDVIYNPVVSEDFNQLCTAPNNHPWLNDTFIPVIIGVGRFVEQKDFTTLIEAFYKVLRKKSARLILLGDGPLHGLLTSQVKTLGISDRVDFVGFQTNPLTFIKRANVLALSSRYEGFGNVLAEALACGTPVVSTDCHFGPSEILVNGKYGKLVPVGDSNALAEAIILTLQNPPDSQSLYNRGREFNVEKAVGLYIDLFERAMLNPRHL